MVNTIAAMSQMKEGRKLSCNQRISLVLVTLVDLMSFCSITLLSVFLPKELATVGEDIQLFGFNVRFSAFIGAVASLIFGSIVPKYGAKNIFLGGVVLSRLGTTLFGTLDSVHNTQLFMCLSYTLRAIESLGGCAYFIAGYAIVFSTFPENVGIVRGLLETIVGIGTTVGPAISELFLFTIDAYGIPYYTVGISVLVLGLTSGYFLDHIDDNVNTGQSLGGFLKMPVTWMTCGVIFMVSVTNSSLDPHVGDYLMKFEIPLTHAGYVYLLNALAIALSSPIWGYLSETQQMNCAWIMPVGLHLTGVSLVFLEPKFLFDFDNSGYFKLFTVGLLGVGMAMALVPTFRCLTLGALEKGFKHTVSTHSYVCAVWSFTFAMGEIFGPGLGCILFRKYSFAAISSILACMNVLMGIVYASFLYVRRKNCNVCCTFHVTIIINK